MAVRGETRRVRGQIHIDNGEVALFSRNGADLTKRFRSLVPTLETIRATSAIIDCEIVSCRPDGSPCFRSLIEQGNRGAFCLLCFDLLQLNGIRVMPLPLMRRKTLLAELIGIIGNDRLQCSGEFEDPNALLAAGERTGLEGVVSKRRDSAYRSGRTNDWVKVKTLAWRTTNRDRFDLLRKKT